MSEMTVMQYRNDSGTTDDSPFGSALNTPADENAVICFGKFDERFVDDNSCGQKENLNLKATTTAVASDTSISTLNLSTVSTVSVRNPEDGVNCSQVHDISPTLESVPSPLISSKSFSSSNIKDLSIDSDLPSFTTPMMEPCCSAISSSPEIDLHRHQRTSSFYNLPNDPICISPSVSMAKQLSEYTSASESLDGLAIDLKAAEEMTNNEKTNPQVEITQASPQEEPFPPQESPSAIRKKIDISTLVIPFQILCFLPWCIAVGCALLVFPKHLEQLVFSSGYYFSSNSIAGGTSLPPPPRGIHRFAHLAEFTVPHVMAFLGFLLVSIWWNPPLGSGLATLALSQGVLSWQDFREDFGVPLGEDDRMSVYWVLKRYAFGEECWGMRKGDDGYFMTHSSNAFDEED
ncbi:hypothetical protein E1B28_000027 [Marasmius oreades]|uniref:Uncharacterized protein n=1 Tax=Marasmius oreades TaxID=181124 RepID=A0A9P8AE18_9AGAR|nr:uncharacterized protein E1B28_000027 [Marasmius oreades]KAG7098053.1 hypothetical protein E1B28_000027 [Marasmius oreades]